MRQHLTGYLALLAVVGALLVVLTNSWARQSGALDQLSLLVDVRHQLVSEYVVEPDEQAMTRAAVEGMIDALEDPYTSYLPAEELERFESFVTGTFSGIGAEVNVNEERLQIFTPLPDSPAWKAGVMAGDIVLEINGESTLGMSLEDAVSRLTGEAGTDVTIRVRHESGEEQTITITRAVINIQSVRGFRRNGDQSYDFMLDDANRIGYVRVTQFTDRTAAELLEALQHLNNQNARAVILDLRFNAGGLLDSALKVSDMFLEGGRTIVSVEGRAVPRRVHQSTPRTIMPDIPVVVIAGETSASAAEIVTGALKDNDRALFVGARTFGKGSVQQIKMLEGGQGALKLTNAYYYIPSGRLIHRRDDSETWGVDPSEGSYVAMSGEQVRKMMEIQREGDQVRNGDHNDVPVTPDYIEQTLEDPQLAAALRAALGRLETGQWPQVGQSDVDAQVRASRRANLVTRRNMLEEQLAGIRQEMADIDAGKPLDNDTESNEQADATLDDTDAEPASTEQPEPSLQGQP